MKESFVRRAEKQRELPGEIRGRGRRNDLIVHNLDRFVVPRLFQHCFDEVPAFALRTCVAVEAASPDHQVSHGLCADEILTRKPGVAINAQRTRLARFRVGCCAVPIENVVGADLHNLRVKVIGNANEVQDSQDIHPIGEIRIGFAIVHAMICAQIHDHFRVGFRKQGSRSRVVCDVKILAREGKEVMTGERIHQISPQLSVRTEYADPHDEIDRNVVYPEKLNSLEWRLSR